MHLCLLVCEIPELRKLTSYYKVREGVPRSCCDNGASNRVLHNLLLPVAYNNKPRGYNVLNYDVFKSVFNDDLDLMNFSLM
jgi:hypothetical protein